MARDAGRQPTEVIEDAVIGLYDELAYAREMLDRRYDGLESGRAKPIPGEEIEADFYEKSAAARRLQPSS
jgi:hypothetical protein